VTDEVNNTVTSFTVNYGFFIFAIRNGTSISAASPVKLMLKITSAAYMDITYPITITSTGPQVVVVNMVKKTDMAAAGIEQTTAPTVVTSDNTGKTMAPIAVQTAMGSQITIPQGTVLKDASGSALTGKLTVASTVYYLPASGLIPQGTVSTGTTIACPMLSVLVNVTDALGKVASPTGCSIFVPVDNTLKNPVTGAPFALGDKLQLGYTDPVTGQVVFTGETQYTAATLSKTSNPAKYFGKNPGFNLNINGNTILNGAVVSVSTVGYSSTLALPITISTGANFLTWNFDAAPIELVYGLGNLPVGQAGSVDYSGWVPTYSIHYNLFKSRQTYGPIDLTGGVSCAYFRIPGNDAIRLSDAVLLQGGDNVIEYKAPANVRIYDVKVVGKCPNKGWMEIIPIGTVITVYDSTGTKILSNITLSQTGEARLYLQRAGNYIVRSRYNNKDYEASLVVDANGVPVISGASVEVIRVNAKVTPIVLQYYLLTTDACN
jgi:hypothetical protein